MRCKAKRWSTVPVPCAGPFPSWLTTEELRVWSFVRKNPEVERSSSAIADALGYRYKTPVLRAIGNLKAHGFLNPETGEATLPLDFYEVAIRRELLEHTASVIRTAAILKLYRSRRGYDPPFEELKTLVGFSDTTVKKALEVVGNYRPDSWVARARTAETMFWRLYRDAFEFERRERLKRDLPPCRYGDPLEWFLEEWFADPGCRQRQKELVDVLNQLKDEDLDLRYDCKTQQRKLVRLPYSEVVARYKACVAFASFQCLLPFSFHIPESYELYRALYGWGPRKFVWQRIKTRYEQAMRSGNHATEFRVSRTYVQVLR